LSTLTITPCQKTVRAGAASRRSAGSPAWLSSSRRTPSRTRYDAPAYLTTENAPADEASSADTPAVAAAMCTSPPTCTPSADTRPARRPSPRLRVTMYSTEGPGTTISARLARTNSSSA
jgi:hypothetical protein